MTLDEANSLRVGDPVYVEGADRLSIVDGEPRLLGGGWVIDLIHRESATDTLRGWASIGVLLHHADTRVPTRQVLPDRLPSNVYIPSDPGMMVAMSGPTADEMRLATRELFYAAEMYAYLVELAEQGDARAVEIVDQILGG